MSSNSLNSCTILVTGASGFVGSWLIKFISSAYPSVTLLGTYNQTTPSFSTCPLFSCDLSKDDSLALLKEKNFDILIHCAAMTNIKECEDNAKKAEQVNVEVTRKLVTLCSEKNATFVFLSTNAVFDGTTGTYCEGDLPTATSVYGKTKIKAENIALQYPRSLILRFFPFGLHLFSQKRNFTSDVLSSLKSHQVYSAFVDSFSSPIYIKTFCALLCRLLESEETGIFHVSCSQKVSRYDLAISLATAAGLSVDFLKKGSLDDLPSSLSYPRDLSFSNSKLQSALGEVPSFTQMLLEFHNDFKELHLDAKLRR